MRLRRVGINRGGESINEDFIGLLRAHSFLVEVQKRIVMNEVRSMSSDAHSERGLLESYQKISFPTKRLTKTPY